MPKSLTERDTVPLKRLENYQCIYNKSFVAFQDVSVSKILSKIKKYDDLLCVYVCVLPHDISFLTQCPAGQHK